MQTYRDEFTDWFGSDPLDQKYNFYRWMVTNTAFFERIKNDKNAQYLTSQITRDQRQWLSDILEIVPKSRSFIIPDTMGFEKAHENPIVQLEEADFALPFENVFLERARMVINTPKGKHVLLGTLFHEIAPNKIRVWNYGAIVAKDVPGGRWAILTKESFVEPNIYLNTSTNSNEHFDGAMILKAFMTTIRNRKDFATGKATAKEKTMYGREKISDYVFVRKSARDEFDKKHSVKVDWKHRWEVMGHWRRHTGKIGKYRDGSYGKVDWTWVVPHTKGAKDMPLIKKTRIYQQEERTV